jgi:hypothetical protein
MTRLLRFLGFAFFPRWMMQREMRRALWTAFLTTAVDQRARGTNIQFSASDFEAWGWLWSERHRLEEEASRLAELLDRMTRINADLKAAFARHTKGGSR